MEQTVHNDMSLSIRDGGAASPGFGFSQEYVGNAMNEIDFIFPVTSHQVTNPQT